MMRVLRAFVLPSAYHLSPAFLAIAILSPGAAVSQMQVPNPQRKAASALGAMDDELRSTLGLEASRDSLLYAQRGSRRDVHSIPDCRCFAGCDPGNCLVQLLAWRTPRVVCVTRSWRDDRSDDARSDLGCRAHHGIDRTRPVLHSPATAHSVRRNACGADDRAKIHL